MKDKLQQEMEVVKTKINIPYIKAKGIKRTKLLQKLNGVFDYKLTLVSATAGFGKTHILASWLGNGFKEGVFTSWVSLDEYDNYPHIFWNNILMSLSINIKKLKEFKELSSGNLMNGEVNLHIIRRILNHVETLEEQVVLILDDFHYISNSDILQGVRFFIKNMPPNMHLVISSRSIPDLGLSRLKAADSLFYITQEELRFGIEECKRFLEKALNDKLKQEDILQIERDTEGWAVALQMASLYLKSSNNNVIKECFSNNSFVFDYLSEEVFLSLTPKIRKFLMVTAIVDEFSAPLSDYLLETKDSKKLIEELENKNLFIISLDINNEVYRYHNLFRNFLKEKVLREHCEAVPSLFCRVGEWYASNHQVIKAITYFIEGEGYQKAVHLIEDLSGILLWKGQASMLADINSKLPEKIVINNPRLILNNAWGYLAKGEINKIEDNVKTAEAILKKRHGEEGVSREQLGEIAILRNSSLLWTKDLDNIISCSERAMQYFEKSDMMLQLINLGRAIAYLLKGEVKSAKEYYQRIFYESMEANIQYTIVTANMALTTLRKWFGEYELAFSEGSDVINKLESDASYPLLGLAYACVADLYLQKNDINRALEMANKGLGLGKLGEDALVKANNNIVLSQIYEVSGLEEKAIEALKVADDGLNYNCFLDTKLNLESIRAKRLIRRRKFNAAEVWFEEIDTLIGHLPFFIYPQVVFARVRLFIAKKQFDNAKELLQSMKTYTVEADGLLTELLLLSAIIAYELGDMRGVKENIIEALKLNKGNGIIMPFLQEDIIMKKLLKSVSDEISSSKDKALKSYLRYIIENFDVAKLSENNKAEAILSSREIELLVLIEKGFSNIDISKKLYISINTVKTHLLNIYTKLDVHSRTGAVSKAREMGLI